MKAGLNPTGSGPSLNAQLKAYNYLNGQDQQLNDKIDSLLLVQDDTLENKLWIMMDLMEYVMSDARLSLIMKMTPYFNKTVEEVTAKLSKKEEISNEDVALIRLVFNALINFGNAFPLMLDFNQVNDDLMEADAIHYQGEPSLKAIVLNIINGTNDDDDLKKLREVKEIPVSFSYFFFKALDIAGYPETLDLFKEYTLKNPPSVELISYIIENVCGYEPITADLYDIYLIFTKPISSFTLELKGLLGTIKIDGINGETKTSLKGKK